MTLQTLPIDVVPNTDPVVFRWKRMVDSLAGEQMVTMEGALPSMVEGAVVDLIALAKRQEQELVGLRKQIEGHADRIAAQSELLTKKAGVVTHKKGQ